MQVSTVVAVIFLAPPTVETARVTYRVECVLCVNLDGLGKNVLQVRWEIVSLDFSLQIYRSLLNII